MQTQFVDYKNVSAQVRAPKVAVFINKKDPYWKHTVKRIIEWYSKMWGGGHNLIIPTDGKTIHEKFWKILEKYNPDYLYCYRYNFEELSVSNPKKYAKERARVRAQLKRQYPDMSNDGIKNFLNRNLNGSAYQKLDLTEGLQEELKHRLAPFYFGKFVARERVSWNSKVFYPLTELEKITPYTDEKDLFCIDLPSRIKNLDLQLMVYSMTGVATKEFRKKLKKTGVASQEMPPNYSIQYLLRDIIKGTADLRGIKLDRKLSQALGDKPKKSWIPEQDYLGQTSFSLSMLKLGRYHKLDEHKDWEEPVVLITGDTIEDFCYYYSLSKMHEDFYWIPKSLLTKFKKALPKRIRKKQKLTELELIPTTVVNELFSKIDYGNGQKKIILTSLSLSERELRPVKNILIKACFSSDIGGAIHINNESDHTHCTLIAIEKDNYTNQQTHAFVNSESVGRVETPKPKNFSYIHPSDHHWIAELSIDQYQPPSLHFLGSQLTSLINGHDVRVSTGGVSYLCPNIGYFGGEIDSVLVKPKLQLVEPLKIFEDYYHEAGYKKVSISDKGLLSKRAIDKFGSLEKVGNFISIEVNRKLIQQFLTARAVYATTGEEIVYLKNSDRNYLNFKAIATTLGSEKTAVELIDKLTEKNIIYRGFIFRCEACFKSDWYSIAETTKSFTCSRCSHKQKYDSSHWKSPSEPSWYYKLDEVIREVFKQNTDVPLMTLYRLKMNSKKSFQHTYELMLWKEDGTKSRPDLEIDINCIADGKIIVGESKANSITLQEVKKYASFTKSLKKYPDRVIFSTFKNNWGREIKQAIKKVQKSEILLSRELFSV